MLKAESIINILVFLAMCVASIYYAFSSLPWLALIPGIASISYWNIIQDKSNVEMYRYADWFLTTPLMLLAILKTNNVTSEYSNIVLILNAMRIGSEYFGVKEYDRTRKLMWYVMGLVLLVPIIYLLLDLSIEKKAALFLASIWCLYPIVQFLRYNYLLRENTTNMSYSLLDAVSKIGFLRMLHI
jgi:bacteriorhodopsin